MGAVSAWWLRRWSRLELEVRFLGTGCLAMVQTHSFVGRDAASLRRQVDVLQRFERGGGVATGAVGLITEPAQAEAIVAEIPEEKKEVIKRMAQRCPIHETLKNPPGLDIDVV